jgi:flagellar basal-body rod modification protein FlgD
MSTVSSSTSSTTSTTSSDFINSLQTRKTTTSTTSTDEAQAKFLKLLTEQLKNQDPLNPTDNAQMTSQMAQINMVDGIDKLNTTLNTLLSNSQSNDVLEATALVGKNVMVSGSNLSLTSGSKTYGGVELPSAADKVTVSIKDSSGLEVRKLELGAQQAGVMDFVWDGLNNSGTAAATGKYSFSVTATQGSNTLKATPLQLTTVNSVLRTSTGGVSLDVGSTSPVSMSDIKQIL